MKTVLLVTMCIVSSLAFIKLSWAEETQMEKAKVEMNSMGRSTKKAYNRAKEGLCGKLTGDSKVECLAKKAKHRVEEGTETVKDKASEIKNQVDTK